MTRVAVLLQDMLARVSITLRRTLDAMATATPPKEHESTRQLLGEIADSGSSYAAFRLTLQMRPTDLDELLRSAGVYRLRGEDQRRAFDACVDGYTVFHDGRLRGKL